MIQLDCFFPPFVELQSANKFRQEEELKVGYRLIISNFIDILVLLIRNLLLT